jgi:hypothetical protein
MEYIEKLPVNRPRLKAVVFDFDGTISTLRYGWEDIMGPLMVEMISGSNLPDERIVTEVNKYIESSTGIQTIYQMQWLAEMVGKFGKNPKAADDPWWYKAEYNRRLMKLVERRKKKKLDKAEIHEYAFIKFCNGTAHLFKIKRHDEISNSACEREYL